MRWSWKYAIITLVLFVVECVIALYVHDKFIRPFFGDVLVVVLIYAALRTILKTKPTKILVAVLLFAVLIEVLQAFNFAALLGLSSNKFARIILGSTFDWFDLLAYFIGGLLAFFGERFLASKSV